MGCAGCSGGCYSGVGGYGNAEALGYIASGGLSSMMKKYHELAKDEKQGQYPAPFSPIPDIVPYQPEHQHDENKHVETNTTYDPMSLSSTIGIYNWWNFIQAPVNSTIPPYAPVYQNQTDANTTSSNY